MKTRLIVCWLAGFAAAVSAPIAAAGGRPAKPCSDGDFRGLYAYVLSGTDLRNNPPTAFSSSGVFHANGRGRITLWNDAFAMQAPGTGMKTVVPDVDFVAAAAAAGSEIVYAVTGDCRLEIVFTAMSPVGPVDFHLRGALASRGREVLLQTGAPYIIGTGQAKRTTAGFELLFDAD